MYLLPIKFQTYINHKIIMLEPQVKFRNSKNMFKEKCIWQSERNYCILFLYTVCFSYYIILRYSDFLVTSINNAYLLVVDWIFSLAFFVGSFEVCYSIVEVVYVYRLIHQSVVVFCLVFVCKSAAQLFSNVHVSFVFCGRSTVPVFVFFNFSNVYVYFLFRHD